MGSPDDGAVDRIYLPDLFTPDNRAPIWSLVLPADTLKGMIRLSFAAYRLSLPPSVLANNRKAHDQKIA